MGEMLIIFLICVMGLHYTDLRRPGKRHNISYLMKIVFSTRIPMIGCVSLGGVGVEKMFFPKPLVFA